jgi:hypothetical protein
LIAPLIWSLQPEHGPNAPAVAGQQPPPANRLVTYAQKAVQRAKDLVDRAGLDAFEVYSTRRQLLRYDDWYAEIADIGQLAPTLKAVLDVLPKPN